MSYLCPHGSRDRSDARSKTTPLLAGILLMCLLSCSGALSAHPAKVVSDIVFLSEKLAEYAIRHNCANPAGLVDLTLPDARGHVIVATLPLDPWGRAYVYWHTGKSTYEIASWGADGVPGGTGEDADVTFSMILAGKY